MIQNGVGIVLDSALESSEISAFTGSEVEVFFCFFPLLGLDILFSLTFSRNLLHQFTDKPKFN